MELEKDYFMTRRYNDLWADTLNAHQYSEKRRRQEIEWADCELRNELVREANILRHRMGIDDYLLLIF